jgi:hypothetical protein
MVIVLWYKQETALERNARHICGNNQIQEPGNADLYRLPPASWELCSEWDAAGALFPQRATDQPFRNDVSRSSALESSPGRGYTQVA